jgi:hypothetical protein
MNLDDIVQYINEDTVRGELAREFQGIISDYQSGAISAEEKNDLVNAVVEGFKATKATSDEDTMRWVVNIATVVSALV